MFEEQEPGTSRKGNSKFQIPKEALKGLFL
jgi:hypothetical protein